MSYTLAPIIVDIAQLKQVIGSKDEELLAMILKQAGCENDEEPTSFRSDNRLEDDESEESGDEGDDDEDDDEEEEIGMKKAITDLLMGRPLVESAGYEYGYALEAICQYLGESPDGDSWCSIRWECLEATGADVLLLTSGSPVALPTIDDFPTIGHLTAQEVTSALAECKDGVKTLAPKGKKIKKTLLQKVLGPPVLLLLKSMMGIRRGPISQDDVQENYREYLQWLQQASSKKAGIVFFYY